MVWSLARSVIVASMALWPVMLLVRQIESRTDVRVRRAWLLLSIFPFFVPELLIGFHYRLTATKLSSGASPLVAAACTELLYSLLQLSRCTAVGVALSMLLPRSEVSRESLHSWELLRSVMDQKSWRRGWLMLRVTGPWQQLLIIWSLMALMIFQEFETAALMQIDRHPVAWSVWLFDAHAARQPLADSLQMIGWPLGCELILLSPAMFLLLRSRAGKSSGAEPPPEAAEQGGSTSRSTAAVIFLSLSILLMLLWPVVGNVKSAVVGFASMANQFSSVIKSSKQIFVSTAFAAASTCLAMNVALAISTSNTLTSGNRFLRRFSLVLLLPGLCGSLVLSLVLLAMFQLSWMRPFYETWLPMLLGQTFAVLPRAVAVVLLLQKFNDRASMHSANLLLASSQLQVRRRASAILWRINTSRWLLGGLVVAHWCFWDVTVASILRPVQLEPVITRLYNEMHYGRAEALMSLSTLAALAPVAMWFVLVILSFLKARFLSASVSEPR